MTRAEETLQDLKARDPRVSLRRLFGLLGAAVDGRVVALALEDRVAVRLPAEDRAEAMGLPGTLPLQVGGRVWRTWVELGSWALDDPETLQVWLDRATDRAPFLPPQVVDDVDPEVWAIFEEG